MTNRIEDIILGKTGESEVKIRRLPDSASVKDSGVVKPAYAVSSGVAKEKIKFKKYQSLVRATTLGIGVVILVAGIGFGGQKVFDSLFADREPTPEEVIEKVGKLVQLPVGENATVATITDLEPLKDQPFFAEAKVGDKVLIYGESKKAILYRPSENKIIVVAPLSQ